MPILANARLLGAILGGTLALVGCPSAGSRSGSPPAEQAAEADPGNDPPQSQDPAEGSDNMADPPPAPDEDTAEQDPLAEFPDDDLLEDTPNSAYLDTLSLAHLRAGDQTFLVWLADDYATRLRGLMYVTQEELAPLPDGRQRGMLFVFSGDTEIGFWMRNTVTPLDVAYLRTDGIIDSIRTMPALDENTYPPDGPYRYALEVTAGSFQELGMTAGDGIELPDLPQD